MWVDFRKYLILIWKIQMIIKKMKETVLSTNRIPICLSAEKMDAHHGRTLRVGRFVFSSSSRARILIIIHIKWIIITKNVLAQPFDDLKLQPAGLQFTNRRRQRNSDGLEYLTAVSRMVVRTASFGYFLLW